MNPLDEFVVAVLLEDDVAGHLPKGKLGRYVKTNNHLLSPG